MSGVIFCFISIRSFGETTIKIYYGLLCFIDDVIGTFRENRLKKARYKHLILLSSSCAFSTTDFQ